MIVAALLAVGLSVNTARAIAIESRERPAWTMLELPQQIAPGADGDYDDLRIVDNRGHKTPYVLNPQNAAFPTHKARLSDVGFVPGRYTQALLDAGKSGRRYSSLSIDSPRGTYFARVDVAISDNRVTWREVRNDALIYRVADSGDPGSQAISLPAARARWIRIRVLDGKSPFPIDAAALADTESVAPEAIRLRAATHVSWRKNERTSILTLDLGTPHTRISEVRFQTTQAEFSRAVSIVTSNDGEHWRYAGNGYIQRFAHGSPTLEIHLPNASARYVRAEISNENDAPLTHLTASVYGPRQFLVFVARSGRSYSLVLTRRTQAPFYDLGILLQHDHPRTFAEANLVGDAQRQHLGKRASISQPLILTIAFAITIVTLGAVTIATLRPRD